MSHPVFVKNSKTSQTYSTSGIKEWLQFSKCLLVINLIKIVVGFHLSFIVGGKTIYIYTETGRKYSSI